MSLVKLNIGGQIFQTTRSTLLKYDCLFRTLLETRVPIQLDESGCIFIDRDPAHFSIILDFLRDESSVPQNLSSKSLEDVRKILNDVEFYLLQNTSLSELCQKMLNEPQVQNVKDEAELFKFIMKSEKDVVVYRFAVHEGEILFPFPRDETFRFLKKVQDRFDVVFVPYKEKEDYNIHAYGGYDREIYPKTGWKTLGGQKFSLSYTPLCFKYEEQALADWPKLKKEHGFE